MSAEHAPIASIAPRQAGKSAEIKERLVARRATLQADAEFIAGELKEIDGQLIELLDGVVGTHDVGDSKVQIKEYSRLDVAWIEQEYPREQYPQLYKTTTAVDTDAVKKQFAPAVLEEHKVRGAKSIVVR